MKIRTTIKAGGRPDSNNHNEALKVRSSVKGGGTSYQHNESLRVRSSLKGGRKAGGGQLE